LEIIEKVLSEGKSCNIDRLSFTGGEPTIHRDFRHIVRRVDETEYKFGLVSNGTNFIQTHRVLIEHKQHFEGITFSLDGASEETHDRLRGKGSYRRVLKAAAICTFRDLPFSLNMVLTAQNRREVAEMVELATRLGGRGLRFGHLMSTPETYQRGLDLTAQERREVESEIWQLRKTAPITIGMAPGYFSENPLFPCAPLTLKEYNLDYRGNLTLCCQLSGHSGGTTANDVVGNLHEISLREACEAFHRRVAIYLDDKRERVGSGRFTELDHFPCWYCIKYLKNPTRLAGGTQDMA
jgi:MoaA/NifB/PqqE/SkfB family radical SAM enzyme